MLFLFKQKTAYEMRISDWRSDVCSSDHDSICPLARVDAPARRRPGDHSDAGGLRRRRRGQEGHALRRARRSEEHTSELQALMRISYAVFCLKKKKKNNHKNSKYTYNRSYKRR